MSSLWRRDLTKTRWGGFIFGRVIPALLLGEGMVMLVRQTFTYRRFTYIGFDADCLGIGFIGLALIPIFAERKNARALLILWIILLAAFLTFLYRNV